MPTTKIARPLTDSQMKELEQQIISSRIATATPFTKKAAIWLLRQTENLCVPVMVILEGPEGSPATEAAYGIHDMCSSGYRTKLNHLIRSMGSDMAMFSATEGLPHNRNQRMIKARLWVSTQWVSSDFDDFPGKHIPADDSMIESAVAL